MWALSPAASPRARLGVLASRAFTLALLAALGGCEPPTPEPDAGAPCAMLFGRPNERTGLDDTACRPRCEGCGERPFEPRAWDASSLDVLRAYTLAAPLSELGSSPYDEGTPSPAPLGTVCAVMIDDPVAHTYHLETFPSADEAEARGGIVTHTDACGICSTLTDLAVYASQPDLTDPVRQCGLMHVTDFDGLVGCLEALGFTRPCAQIWAYNTEHTRAACGSVCLRLLRAPYHAPDGTLNECLACDERESGPVFKAVAGRTRRNSGLANAMCRPCSEVFPIDHDYPGL